MASSPEMSTPSSSAEVDASPSSRPECRSRSRAITATSSAPRRERTKATVRTPWTTRSVSSSAESAELLTDLVVQGVRTVAFVRSRRGAELVAVIALERDLHSGRLLGLASTSALELGVDISGLDAIVLAGYPGTRASLWQQAGRAGRSGQGALAVLVARDDPLDTFLVHHPEALFDQPVEATVLDPANPYVLAPHLCAAAAEIPLTEEDLELFGPASAELL